MTSVSAIDFLPKKLVAQLRRHAAGKLIYVPVVRRANRNKNRDAAIRKARQVGASVRELSRSFNLSESRIWKICRGLHPGQLHPRSRRRA